MALCTSAAVLLIITSLLHVLTCTAGRQFGCKGREPYIDPDHFLVKHRCKLFHKVCVDQGVLRYHDENLIKGDSFAWNISKEEPLDFTDYVHHASLNPDKPMYGYNLKYEKLPTRYPSTTEYRRAKYFSNCTLPVVIYQNTVSNFQAFIMQTVAWVYAFQHDKKTDGPIPPTGVAPDTPGAMSGAAMNRRVTLVVPTAVSLPLKQFHRQMLSPFSELSVTSFGDLGARHPPITKSEATAEGAYVRCFQRLALCRLYDRRDDAKLAAQVVAQQAAQSYAASWFKGSGALKVLIEQRTGVNGTRQILNLEHLVQACNAHTWSLGDTFPNGVECRAITFGKQPQTDLRLLASADVLLSVHGAGAANGLFLPNGASLVVVRPFEFAQHTKEAEEQPGEVCTAGSRFPESRLLCWFANIGEAEDSQPGLFEARGVTHGPYADVMWRRRDRNVVLRLHYLEFMLKRIAKVNKLWEVYQHMVLTQKHVFVLNKDLLSKST